MAHSWGRQKAWERPAEQTFLCWFPNKLLQPPLLVSCLTLTRIREQNSRKGMGWFCSFKGDYDSYSSYFKFFFYGGAKFHNFSLDRVKKLLVKMVQIPQNTAKWIWKKWKGKKHTTHCRTSGASLHLPHSPCHKIIAHSTVRFVKNLSELSTPQKCRLSQAAVFSFQLLTDLLPFFEKDDNTENLFKPILQILLWV